MGFSRQDTGVDCHFLLQRIFPTQRSNLASLAFPALADGFFTTTATRRASLIVQLVKNLPAMQEVLVQFLGQEDPLEKRQATHSSILGLPWWLSW